MNIGIDFDNTLVNTKEITKKYLDIYYPNNNLKSYHDLPEEEVVSFLSKTYIDILNDLSILPNARETLDFLRKNGCKLILITARGDRYIESDKAEALLKDFFKKKNIVFDDEVYCATHKVEACIEKNIDIMIDDLDYLLSEIVNENIKVLKFGNYSEKYPYALDWFRVEEYFRKEFKCE